MTCSTVWHFCWGFQCLAQWLFDWQTLITGLLALGAAGLTLLFARGQLGAARDQIDAQREQLPVLRDQIWIEGRTTTGRRLSTSAEPALDWDKRAAWCRN